jgi:hypothetical protein
MLKEHFKLRKVKRGFLCAWQKRAQRNIFLCRQQSHTEGPKVIEIIAEGKPEKWP